MGTEVGQGLLEAYRKDKGSEMGTDWDKEVFCSAEDRDDFVKQIVYMYINLHLM